MNRFKRLTSVVLAGVLTLGMSVGVFATAGISTSEQTILDTAKAEAVELGVDVNTSDKYKAYMSQASTYLVKNELNQAQVDAMVKAIEDASATAEAMMKEKGVDKLSQLSSSDFAKLYDSVGAQIADAAKAVGIVVKKTEDGYEVEDLVKDSDKTDTKADTYIQANPVIKQTGAEIADVDMTGATVETATDMTSTVVISVLFVGAVVVCGVVAKKKNLFSGAEV